MINLEDIITAINNNTNATLVLHQKMTSHPKFKIYKVFSYSLYRIDTKEKELLLDWSTTKNVSMEDVNKTKIECDKQYLSTLVNWLSSDNFRNLKE